MLALMGMQRGRWLWLAAGVGAAVVAGHTPLASETLAGPVPAEVIEVIDGDTLRVRARIWLGQEVEINVRLSDVDTPELRGRCAAEREMAVRARGLVAASIDDKPVSLSAIRYGKFAGRIVARVETAAGEILSETLINAGLGRAYGGRERPQWCEPPA
jgi:endonuclease YncB( thermonuclease family)